MVNRVLKGKPPRGEWNPDKVFTFDNETWGKDATKFAIGMVKNLSGTISKRFTDSKTMKEFIISQESGSIFYAHNAEYDMAGLFDVEEFIDMDKVYPSRLIVAFMGDIQFRDSLCLFPMPLSKLGESLGFPKGKTPQKFIEGIECEIDDNDWKYLERDCDILVKGISELHDLFIYWITDRNQSVKQHVLDYEYNKKFPLPFTMASLAYTVFSSSFWPQEWRSTKQRMRNGQPTKMCPKGCKFGRAKFTLFNQCSSCGSQTILAKISNGKKLFFSELFDHIGREAYAGGRTQVIGKPTHHYPNVSCYDANSLYPSVMLSNPYPSPRNHYVEPPSLWKLNHILNNPERLCIAKLMLNGDEATSLFMPALDSDERRDYNVKEFDGYLCEPEIKAALERGWKIESVEELYSFKPEYIFKDFVEYFYNLRLEYQKANDEKEIMVKLILVSLYGKFGQKDFKKRIENRKEVERITKDEDWWDNYEIKLWNNYQGVYLMEIEASRNCENSFAPIAAFVTSYGRVEMLKAIEATDAIYCDTDSIFSTKSDEEIAKVLPIGSGLGEWKKEGNTVAFFQAWEPKVYRTFDENMKIIAVKHKGVNRSDGDLTKPQQTEMMNKYRSAKNRPNLEWGKFRIVEKKSKRYIKDKKLTDL